MIKLFKRNSIFTLVVLAFASFVVLRLTIAGTDTVEMRYDAATKLCAQYVDCSQLYITGTAATTIKSQAAAAAPAADPTFTGTVNIPTPFSINSISMTSTAAELNILDGVTATAAILNLTLTGSASSRSAVRADGGDAAPLGSQYNSTAGKMYFKVANTTADTDWELVTTTAAD